MFQFISWSEFLFFTLFIIITYWLAIAGLYCWTEVVSFFKKNITKVINTASTQANQVQESFFDECNQCASKIKSFIRENPLHGIDKKILIRELKQLVKTYCHFIGTMWQMPIDHLIEYECFQHISATFTEADIKKICFPIF
jgi:hypothetical protein